MEIDGKTFGKSGVADLPPWALMVGAMGLGAAGLYAYIRGRGGEFTVERLGQRLDAIEQIAGALLEVLSEEGWSKARGAVVAASLMGILEIARGSADEVKKLAKDAAKLQSVRAKLVTVDAQLEEARKLLLECRAVADSKKRIPVDLNRRMEALLDKVNTRKLEELLRKKRAEEMVDAEDAESEG
jgi:hypothetical protein